MVVVLLANLGQGQKSRAASAVAGPNRLFDRRYQAAARKADIHLLRRYERARKEDILSMQLTTDALKKLFNNDNPLLRNMRNLGLNATNRIAPLKKMLARHALN